MVDSALVRELACVAPVREQEPLSRHTTFGIGGPADIYAVAATTEALRQLWRIAHSYGAPAFVLGAGSNILVGDGGIRGVVIENRARGVEGPFSAAGGQHLQAASGVPFAPLARRLCRAGVAGLEWAAGIPGTLGGAVVYNAGAYGGCLAHVLCSITVADGDGEVQEIAADCLNLAYRHSAFRCGQLRDCVILSVELALLAGEAEALRQRVAELDRQRTTAQPSGRNAGSIFKNHPEHPAWWLIDQVGLRGFSIGDAQFSSKHTNFIINCGGATAAQVRALMALARARVYERFGTELEPEVTLVGEGF